MQPLKQRRLEIAADFAGFEYPYHECIKRFLGFCTKTERRREKYDLADPAVRKMLIDLDFVAVVRPEL